MHHIKRTRFSTKSRWSSVMKSCKGLCEYMPRKCVSDVGVAGFSSTATERIAVNDFAKRTRKDISTVEDPFDAPTYNIPEQPVTLAEGASYSVIILAGLGIAAAAGYAVFKELIFEPKE